MRLVMALLRKVERMFGAAARAVRFHHAFLHRPVAVANLDVDPPAVVVGRQQHRRTLAMAFPAVDHRLLLFARLPGSYAFRHLLSPTSTQFGVFENTNICSY